MSGQGFQFTPFGFTALGDASGGQGDEVSPAITAPSVTIVEQAIMQPVPTAHRAAPVQRVSPTAPLRPRDLIRDAKARVRELRTEMRRMKRLELELAELERLIAAANRPLASVRTIDPARRSR